MFQNSFSKKKDLLFGVYFPVPKRANSFPSLIAQFLKDSGCQGLMIRLNRLSGHRNGLMASCDTISVIAQHLDWIHQDPSLFSLRFRDDLIFLFLISLSSESLISHNIAINREAIDPQNFQQILFVLRFNSKAWMTNLSVF